MATFSKQLNLFYFCYRYALLVLLLFLLVNFKQPMHFAVCSEVPYICFFSTIEAYVSG